MFAFKSNSNNYNVFPIKVKNSTEPWIEICQEEVNQVGRSHDYVVIEAIMGKDSLDIKELRPIFDDTEEETPFGLLGSYYAEEIEDSMADSHSPVIVKAKFSCLRESAPSKHSKMSSYMAASKLFMNMLNNKIKNASSTPYIIINNRMALYAASIPAISEMVREITAAYVNVYQVYPTIFVAFSNDSFIENVDIDKMVKKQKKKKKKNKKK